MPDFLDISHLRARGLQPGEEELPDIAPPIVIPDDPKGIYWFILSCIPLSFYHTGILFNLHCLELWTKTHLCTSVIEDCYNTPQPFFLTAGQT